MNSARHKSIAGAAMLSPLISGLLMLHVPTSAFATNIVSFVSDSTEPTLESNGFANFIDLYLPPGSVSRDGGVPAHKLCSAIEYGKGFGHFEKVSECETRIKTVTKPVTGTKDNIIVGEAVLHAAFTRLRIDNFDHIILQVLDDSGYKGQGAKYNGFLNPQDEKYIGPTDAELGGETTATVKPVFENYIKETKVRLCLTEPDRGGCKNPDSLTLFDGDDEVPVQAFIHSFRQNLTETVPMESGLFGLNYHQFTEYFRMNQSGDLFLADNETAGDEAYSKVHGMLPSGSYSVVPDAMRFNPDTLAYENVEPSPMFFTHQHRFVPTAMVIPPGSDMDESWNYLDEGFVPNPRPLSYVDSHEDAFKHPAWVSDARWRKTAYWIIRSDRLEANDGKDLVARIDAEVNLSDHNGWNCVDDMDSSFERVCIPLELIDFLPSLAGGDDLTSGGGESSVGLTLRYVFDTDDE